jgi:hypothetical protein
VLRTDLFRLPALRCALIAAAFVFMLSGRSQAAPLCTGGSLTNYLSLGSCSIGSATFSDFSLITPLPTGATPVSTDAVTVVPIGDGVTTVGFQFLFGSSAAAGDLNELLFGYSASATGFTNATLALGGAGASGDGVVTGVQNLCIGGTFTPGGFDGCAGSENASIVFATAGDSSLIEILEFASTPLLGIINDIAIDGGLNGSAALGAGFVNLFNVAAAPAAVPEPATVTLLATGMAFVLRARRRKSA